MAEGKHIELALYSVYTTFGVCMHQCFHTCQHIPSVPRGHGWWNICHATCMWGFLKSTFNRSWGCLCNFSVKDCDDYCTFSYTCCLTFENSSSVCMHPSVPVCGTASVLLIGYYSWRATNQMLCCEWGLDPERGGFISDLNTCIQYSKVKYICM